MVMTRLAEPFMQEAKMRQFQAPGEAQGVKKSVVPNLVQQIDPIDTAAILAEKGGISKGNMQPSS